MGWMIWSVSLIHRMDGWIWSFLFTILSFSLIDWMDGFSISIHPLIGWMHFHFHSFIHGMDIFSYSHSKDGWFFHSFMGWMVLSFSLINRMDGFFPFSFIHSLDGCFFSFIN